jgi:hypothetical protein
MLCLLLSACASYPEKIIRFEGVVEQRSDAAKYCKTEFKIDERSCTVVNAVAIGVPRNRCRIIISPEEANENELLLGHEFHHCMTGK